MNRRFLTPWLVLVSLTSIPLFLASSRADEPQTETQTQTSYTVVTTTAEPGSPDETQVEVAVEVTTPGEYWLGVVCTPVDDAVLKGHLGIEHGFLVQEIVPDSPAAKAGLQPQDILTRVGDQALENLKTLVEATEKAKDQPLTLTLIRKGQQQTVEVTPAKRPAEAAAVTVTSDKETTQEWQALQKALRTYQFKLGEVQEDAAKRKMIFVMPGLVLPEEAQDFPQDLQVTITKKGQDPVKITVQRGDQQWELDADSLDKLPEDIRPHVKQMFGRSVSVGIGKQFDWTAHTADPTLVQPLDPEAIKKSLQAIPRMRLELRNLGDKLPGEVRKRIDVELKEAREHLDKADAESAQALDQIRAELKELREAVEKLRAERAKEQPPAAGNPQ
jgi:membrane-associated protease RseP (regulator of RpoE activity)